MLKQVLVDSLRRGVALSTFQVVTNVMTDGHYNMPVALVVEMFHLVLQFYIRTHTESS